MADYDKMREYARGYDDGARSLDAERYAIVHRLRALPLDGGSHENLSQIAGAIWHSDFGWTASACAALRDKIIELFGGAYLRETDGYKPENERWQCVENLSKDLYDALSVNDQVVDECVRLRDENMMLRDVLTDVIGEFLHLRTEIKNLLDAYVEEDE